MVSLTDSTSHDLATGGQLGVTKKKYQAVR